MADTPELSPEDLKNMSPEQINELQQQQCIFCHIVRGDVASKKVYEDDKALAILDINPANPGHVLLMPREHFSILPMVPESLQKHLFLVAKQLSLALVKALQSDAPDFGTTLFVANGAAAGQKAQHFMIHIIPRVPGDRLPFNPQSRKLDPKIFDKLYHELKAKIGHDTGTHIEESEPVPRNVPPPPEEKIQEAPKKKLVKKEKQDPEDAPAEAERKEKDEPTVTLDDIARFITGR